MGNDISECLGLETRQGIKDAEQRESSKNQSLDQDQDQDHDGQIQEVKAQQQQVKQQQQQHQEKQEEQQEEEKRNEKGEEERRGDEEGEEEGEQQQQQHGEKEHASNDLLHEQDNSSNSENAMEVADPALPVGENELARKDNPEKITQEEEKDNTNVMASDTHTEQPEVMETGDKDRYTDIKRVVEEVSVSEKQKKKMKKKLNVNVVGAYDVTTPQGEGKGHIYIAQGSVLDFHGDAVVNATNEGGITGGGLDGAFNKAGGQDLLDARKRLPVLYKSADHGSDVRIPTGTAKSTTGGKLNAKIAIHAVGPNFAAVESPQQGKRLLRQAYQSVLEIATEEKIHTIGCGLLSAGIFRGDQELTEVISVIIDSVISNIAPDMSLYLFGFKPEEKDALLSEMSKRV